MTARDTSGRVPSASQRQRAGTVDFTLMYATHDAFRRDLARLTTALQAGLTGEPAVRAGWATLKNQLHVHHTAEDAFLWPPLLAKVTKPGETAVLEAMEAEHARLDPLLARVDASMTSPGRQDLEASADELADALAAHMEHEEAEALPLVEAHLGVDGWAAFKKAAGRSQGLRGGAEYFPWMLDGATTDIATRILKNLPPPARLLYRAVWRPRYRRTPHWVSAAS